MAARGGRGDADERGATRRARGGDGLDPHARAATADTEGAGLRRGKIFARETLIGCKRREAWQNQRHDRDR